MSADIRVKLLLLLLLSVGLPIGALHAQPCEGVWETAIGNPGMDDRIWDLCVFDDATGPSLYAAGTFTQAGGLEALLIAEWTPPPANCWSPVGGGLPGVESFTMTVFDDGTGPALYVGGSFFEAGGLPVSNIARWDGQAWSDVGGGFVGRPFALTVFNDGTGSALYAAGNFWIAGGMPVERAAKWDGSVWSPLAGGLNARVWSLTVFEDGTGPALYAGGEFIYAYNCENEGCPVRVNRIAKWDGEKWSALGSGIDSGTHVLAMSVFDDGTGPGLYVGGSFDEAGGVSGTSAIARWDGASWSPLGGGVSGGCVAALAAVDDGTGAALYGAGNFTSAGGVAVNNIAKWDGHSWSALGEGITPPSAPTVVLAMTGFDDGHGPALYVGGNFSEAGGQAANNIARWVRILGDLDCDGDVDLADLAILLAAYGACEGDPNYDPAADIDGSGCVDLSDLAALLANYGAGM